MSVQKGFRIVCNNKGCGEAGPWIERNRRDDYPILHEDAEDDMRRVGWRLVEGGILCPLCARIADRGLTLAANAGHPIEAEGGGE